MGAYSFSDKFPHETFDLSRMVDRIEKLPFPAALNWKGPESPGGEDPVPAEWQWLGARPLRLRNGWVPSLLQSLDIRLIANGSHQWRKYMRVDGALASATKAPGGGGPNPFQYPKHVLLPCSTARGEEALALRTFFADRETGRPIVHARTRHAVEPPIFLEIGGMTGRKESTTWVLERCLGWRGVLVEAQPKNFKALIFNRPSTFNLHFAVCSSSTEEWVRFEDIGVSMGHVQREENSTSGHLVQCGHLRDYLSALNLTRLDYLSIDVEGSEPEVLRSLNFSTLSVGVVSVEVRGDGRRRQVMELLLAAGLHYVGQLNARPTIANFVTDDFFINFSHFRQHFPRSRVLKWDPTL